MCSFDGGRFLVPVDDLTVFNDETSDLEDKPNKLMLIQPRWHGKTYVNKKFRELTGIKADYYIDENGDFQREPEGHDL